MLDAAALERIVAGARERGVVALAVQASVDRAMRADVIGISLVVQAGARHYVPLGHRYLGCPPLLRWEEVRGILGPLLADPRVTKVGHDLKRAAIALSRAGVPLADPLFDTMLAAYLIDPEAPNGIKDLARRELGLQIARFDDVTGKARAQQPPFDELDIESASSFSNADADVAFSLHARFAPRLAAEGLEALMRDVEMPLERVLIDVEMRGVLVDVSALEAIGRDVDRQLRELESECKAARGERLRAAFARPAREDPL